MKKELCHFSGLPIYPGHGRRFVPQVVVTTKPVLPFVSRKARKMFLRKKNARVISWTAAYRKLNKKGKVTEEQIRKRARKVKKVQRGFVGLDLEELKKKKESRTLKPAAKPKPKAKAPVPKQALASKQREAAQMASRSKAKVSVAHRSR